MGLPVSTIRARIATKIATLSGWTESRYVFDLFGSDSRHVMHKSFAVGASSTIAEPGARSRRHSGQLSTTAFAVRFAVRVRADAQVTDYDAALDAEEDLAQAVLAMSMTDLAGLELSAVPARDVSPGGEWFLGSLVFNIKHLYPTE